MKFLLFLCRSLQLIEVCTHTEEEEECPKLYTLGGHAHLTGFTVSVVIRKHLHTWQLEQTINNIIKYTFNVKLNNCLHYFTPLLKPTASETSQNSVTSWMPQIVICANTPTLTSEYPRSRAWSETRRRRRVDDQRDEHGDWWPSASQSVQSATWVRVGYEG